MNRYWVSWWSGYFVDEGCSKPPFQIWITGARNRKDSKRDDFSICSVIDANNEEEIWEHVKRYFPDYEARFCDVTAPDFVPGDRFLDFENSTSLV